MADRFALVDAFVAEGLRGNPAGVVLMEQPWSEQRMQEFANEVQQAETAFLHGGSLRWFTPVAEVDLCGHATLAAAAALDFWGLLGEEARFQTASGELVCRRAGAGRFSLDFPQEPASPTAPLAHVPQALWTGASRMDWLAELPDESAVRAYEPDFAAISAAGARGLIITAPGDEVDFVSRFFAPQFGVPEDHVTGSAHCTLAVHWAERLGRTEMVGRQLSPRGGEVAVQLTDDGRTLLSGQARVRVEGVAL